MYTPPKDILRRQPVNHRSPPDWVVTKEFLTFTQDEQVGFVFSNSNLARRRLVIKAGDKFIGVGNGGHIICEGYCLVRDGYEDSPLVDINELFGVVAMVYKDSGKIFKLRENDAQTHTSLYEQTSAPVVSTTPGHSYFQGMVE